MKFVKVKAKNLKVGDTIVTATGNGTVGYSETHSHTIPARVVERTVIDVNMTVGIDGKEGKLVQNMQVFADDYITIIREESGWSKFWSSLFSKKKKAETTSNEIAPLTVKVE